MYLVAQFEPAQPQKSNQNNSSDAVVVVVVVNIVVDGNRYDDDNEGLYSDIKLVQLTLLILFIVAKVANIHRRLL